jgi:hypothetical protein
MVCWLQKMQRLVQAASGTKTGMVTWRFFIGLTGWIIFRQQKTGARPVVFSLASFGLFFFLFGSFFLERFSGGLFSLLFFFILRL